MPSQFSSATEGMAPLHWHSQKHNFEWEHGEHCTHERKISSIIASALIFFLSSVRGRVSLGEPRTRTFRSRAECSADRATVALEKSESVLSILGTLNGCFDPRSIQLDAFQIVQCYRPLWINGMEWLDRVNPGYSFKSAEWKVHENHVIRKSLCSFSRDKMYFADFSFPAF